MKKYSMIICDALSIKSWTCSLTGTTASSLTGTTACSLTGTTACSLTGTTACSLTGTTALQSVYKEQR